MESMPVVPDASPLIVLGKMEQAELLRKLYGRVLVTPSVWEEAVTRGREMGARDAAYLEKFAEGQRISRARLSAREQELAQRLRNEARVGRGESEVLAVANIRKALAVLDEKAARAAAVGLGVAHNGTAGVLYEAFLSRLISYQKLVGLLEEFCRLAWVSPELVAGILRRAREVEER